MKWEYKLVDVDSKLTTKRTIGNLNEELNKYGGEGWELVNFQGIGLGATFVFVFKRPSRE